MQCLVSIRSIVHKARHVRIHKTSGDDNNTVLEVGYRAKAKPYEGEISDDPALQMNPVFKNAWLDHIELQYRGFKHHHTTYYGYVEMSNVVKQE